MALSGRRVRSHRCHPICPKGNLSSDASSWTPTSCCLSCESQFVAAASRPSSFCAWPLTLPTSPHMCFPAFRAQEPDVADQRAPIRVEVSLVSLIASVLDKNNRPAPDLQRDQFEIYEERKPQKIELFEAETKQPLHLALMIDSSLSEIKELQFETEAAARFIGQIVRPDRPRWHI